MHLRRRGVIALLVAGSMAGGAVGATVVSAASSTAATTTSTSTKSPSTPPPGGYAGPRGGGTFHPNENPAHEKTESAQREAQENAGQVPTVP